MLFLQLILMCFCTAVCALYLLSGGYKVIRNYAQSKTDKAVVDEGEGIDCRNDVHGILHTLTIDTCMRSAKKNIS
ncbi:DUF1378 family protein [Escherichia coli]|nr:DUF1378 family protein [Escherichia coli]